MNDQKLDLYGSAKAIGDTFSALSALSADPMTCEVLLQPGFNDFELAAVLEVFSVANRVTHRKWIQQLIVSDQAGLIEGANGCLIQAHEISLDKALPVVLLVIGGGMSAKTSRPVARRIRQLQNAGKKVVLFSEAATRFIQEQKNFAGPVATHWRDAITLNESGYFPSLQTSLYAKTSGIITCAGRSAVIDIVLRIIAGWISPALVVEIANELLHPTVRSGSDQQPVSEMSGSMILHKKVTDAISIMEETTFEPLPIPTLSKKVGISTRHLERLFTKNLKTSPYRYYRGLRLRRARSLIEGTNMSITEVSVATGFSTTSNLSVPFKEIFGMTPTDMRNSRVLFDL